MEPEAKIRQMLCDLLNVDEEELSDDAFLSDDLDMLPDDLEELVATLNEEFELAIPDVDAEDWETVADVVNYVLDKLANE